SPAKNLYSPLMELEKLLTKAATSQSVPKVNIIQNDDYTELRIALPGLNKKDIDMNVNDNILTIKSVKEEKQEMNEGSTILLKEFDYANFKLEYKLSENVDLDKIEAKYNNGILEVKLPFKKEETVNKKIELK
ncbi:MAG TPA: Hsp20/alpha crystallin family protein, partial [Bacteroidetes bacterium]|nr:Hsp20/alpha crystallin family protein [Bacteroidota bacterium]